MPGTEFREKLPDFVLKQNNERDDADIDNLVHNGTQQLHLEHETDHQPNYDEYEHTGKKPVRRRPFRIFVETVKDVGDYNNVYIVYKSRSETHFCPCVILGFKVTLSFFSIR